jgi:hypothetical protein
MAPSAAATQTTMMLLHLVAGLRFSVVVTLPLCPGRRRWVHRQVR